MKGLNVLVFYRFIVVVLLSLLNGNLGLLSLFSDWFSNENICGYFHCDVELLVLFISGGLSIMGCYSMLRMFCRNELVKKPEVGVVFLLLVLLLMLLWLVLLFS